MTCDDFCVIYDGGKCDIILYSSFDEYSCNVYKDMVQQYYDKPLHTKPRSHIRELVEDWAEVRICRSVGLYLK